MSDWDKIPKEVKDRGFAEAAANHLAELGKLTPEERAHFKAESLAFARQLAAGMRVKTGENTRNEEDRDST